MLSLRVIEELLEALRSAEQSGARVAVLRAQGKVFSAGHDLSEIVRHVTRYSMLIEASRHHLLARLL